MKIKEVEQVVGITRTNIYFYEKEGLLNPTRTRENNYREYSEEDVQKLQQIKILRVLGVSIPDIKLLEEDNVSLEEIMKRRLKELEEEEKELKNLRKVCTTIIEKDMDVSSLNEDILTGDKKVWKVRLDEILKRDIVEEIITKEQVNAHITVFLLYGYFINVLVSLFCGDFFLHYVRGKSEEIVTWHNGTVEEVHYNFVLSPLLFVFLLVVAACFIGIYFRGDVKSHLLIFHASAIVTTPLIIEISRTYTDGYVQKLKGYTLVEQFSATEMAVFWGLIMLYVLILFLLSKVWDKLFTKARYVLPVAAIFTTIYTVIAFGVTGAWKVPVVIFLVMTCFIGVSWTNAITDREVYNRYYAVSATAKMMNVVGAAMEQRGRGSAWAWMK